MMLRKTAVHFGIVALSLVSGLAISQRGRTEWQIISEEPKPCSECLRLKTVVVLGDTAGPGELEEARDVVRDREGRYWVGQAGHLKVFSPSGRFVRSVGRSGQGPLEFSWARPMFVDSAGRIAVFDRNNRVTLIRPTFEYDSSYSTPMYVRGATPVSRDEYVVNGWAATADGIGQPLHLLRGARIIRSFGMLKEEVGIPMGQMDNDRVFSVFPDGRIIGSRAYSYEIGIWSRDGSAELAALQGATLNPGLIRTAFSRDNPIPHQIMAIRPLDNDRVVVGSARRRPDWLNHVVEHSGANGRGGMTVRAGSGWNDILSGRIDVVDVPNHRVVGRLETREIVIRFLDREHVVLERYLDSGVPQLVVASIHFDPNGR